MIGYIRSHKMWACFRTLLLPERVIILVGSHAIYRIDGKIRCDRGYPCGLDNTGPCQDSV